LHACERCNEVAIGLAIKCGVGSGVDENEAEQSEAASANLIDGEGRVVDGAEGITGDEQDGEMKGGREIRGRQVGGIGGEEAARALDEEGATPGGETVSGG
jgi:hypothetical protein